MKTQVLLVALVAVVVVMLTGCPQTKTGDAPQPPQANTTVAAPEAAPVADTGAPLGSIKVGDKAVCAVCVAKGDKPEPEEAKATLDYQGKTYAFCSEEEKAEFIREHTQ